MDSFVSKPEFSSILYISKTIPVVVSVVLEAQISSITIQYEIPVAIIGLSNRIYFGVNINP